MRKVAYIIPGFTEYINEKKYIKIAGFFKSRGIKPILTQITWKYKTMSDYVDEFLDKYEEIDNQEVYLFGFSLGSMISFIASNKIRPKALILCSLSPYFNEDLKYVKKWWAGMVGKRRMKDYRNHSFNKIAKTNRSKIILIAGSKEPKEVGRRVKDANKKLKNSKLIIVEGAKHDIKNKDYMKTIQRVISEI